MEVLVCKSCGQGKGEELVEALGGHAAPTGCLSACSKACTMMVRAPGKPCYVLGGLTIPQCRDIVHFLHLYRLSETGYVGWSLRPESLKDAIITRLPPVEAKVEEPEGALGKFTE